MRRKFGELELAILNAVKANGRMTVKEVQERLDQSTRYTTVMTVMSRLADKGELCREKCGRSYEYWLPETQSSVQLPLLERLKHRLFGGKTGAMVSYLLQSGEISEEEIREVEALLQQAKARHE